jgi:NAD(P)-dependent dehydrogenase (short-subunit alcohol dehydrogenase family)
MSGRVVVVTGANRGIGLEVARQCGARGDTVVLGSRDPVAGRRAEQAVAAAARQGGGRVTAYPLDVCDPDGLAALAQRLEAEVGRVDVLVNNAAVHYDTWQTSDAVDLTVVGEAWQTNVVGAWRTTLALLNLLRHSQHPRVVMVSSEAGSLAAMGGGTPAYHVTKAALNALTLTLAGDLRADRILVNAVCPGWTATDMGGHGGRPVAAGAASVLFAADLPDGGPTGTFTRDGQPIPW